MNRFSLLALLLVLPLAARAETPEAEVTVPRPVVSEFAAFRADVGRKHVGTVAARFEVDLGFSAAGTIAARLVDRADVVAKGDVLARLDPTDFAADLRAAEAGVSAAQAQADLSRDRRDRLKTLVANGTEPQVTLDDAEKSLVAAEAQLEQAQANLAQARDMMGFTTLTAPQDGVIAEVYENAGTTLKAGQAVLRLSGTKDLEVVVDFSEQNVASIAPGTEYLVTLIANPEVTARAWIDRIEQVAEANTQTRRAYLRLDAPPPGFRLGALTHVSPARSADPVVVVPAAALVTPDTAPAVWVVDASTRTVRLTPVTLGERRRDYVAVTVGIEAGQEIVTRGVHSLQDGQQVGARINE